MKPELEALVLAFDAVRQARSGDEAERAVWGRSADILSALRFRIPMRVPFSGHRVHHGFPFTQSRLQAGAPKATHNKTVG